MRCLPAGCGYDVLIGNPDGESFKNGGLDPGLKPAKFVLLKTFTAKSGYCPDEGTCVEIGGTFAEETYSLNADLEQYRKDYSSLWSADNDGSVRIHDLIKNYITENKFGVVNF